MAVEGDDEYLRSVMDESFTLPSMDFDELTFSELDVLGSLLDQDGSGSADLQRDIFANSYDTSLDDISDSVTVTDDDSSFMSSNFGTAAAADDDMSARMLYSSSYPANSASSMQSRHMSIAQLLLSTSDDENDSKPESPPQAASPVLNTQTFQLLSQAGIHQPAQRQIRLHSELAKHLTVKTNVSTPESAKRGPMQADKSELARHRLAKSDDSHLSKLLLKKAEMKSKQDKPKKFVVGMKDGTLNTATMNFNFSQLIKQLAKPADDSELVKQLSANIEEPDNSQNFIFGDQKHLGAVQSTRQDITHLVAQPTQSTLMVQSATGSVIQPTTRAVIQPVHLAMQSSSQNAATQSVQAVVQQPRQIVLTTQAPHQTHQVQQISLEQLKQLLSQSAGGNTDVTSAKTVPVILSPSVSSTTMLQTACISPSTIVTSIPANSQAKVPIARIASAPQKPVMMSRPSVRLVPQSDVKVLGQLDVVTGDSQDQEMKSSSQPEGRSSHNVVEKRYRMSINDKLGELRELVDGKDSKLNKSGVLRKAIDHIKHLKSANKRLKQENTLLKFAMAGQQTNVEDLMQSVQSIQQADRYSVSDASPLGSYDSGMEPNSPLTSEITESEGSLSPPSYLGLLDRTRLFLCVFMISLFVVNPFGGLFALSQNHHDTVVDPGSVAAGRTLKHVASVSETMNWTGWLLPAAVIWVVNSIIAVGILITLFVFGEPVTKNSSSSSVCYWRHRSQADVYLQRGSYVEAVTQMRGCLLSLGRPLPTTNLDLVASLFWNFLRQVFHRAGMCRWFEIKAGSLWRNVTQQEIKMSARDATVIYHKLLQLHLTDHVNQGMWSGLNLALCAVNLADVASDSLPKDGVAEIYVLAAMTIRFYFPARLQFFARYFLSRARRKCLSCPSAVSVSLQWLCQPIGHRYFVDASWTGCYGNNIYSSCVNELDPLAHITRGFREHIMEKACRSLVTPGYKNHIGLGTDNTTPWMGHNAAEALTYIHLLTELSSGFETCPKIGCGFGNTASMKNGVDHLSRWWAGILAVAAHWLAASDDASSLVAAERFYPVVDSLPKSLQAADCSVIKSVYTAYKARRLSLHGSDGSVSYSCLQLCNKAGELLSDSISQPDSAPVDLVTKALQLLVGDWLLNTRTEMWLAEHGALVKQDDGGHVISSPMVISGDELSAFQRDLTSLRSLAHGLKAAVPRVFLHEATLRLMMGANPVNVLYSRSLRRRRHLRSLSMSSADNVPDNLTSLTSSTSHIKSEEDDDPVTDADVISKELQEDRDRAGAILQACRQHLTHQRATLSTANVTEMLDEAAAIYARLGDRKAVQDCHNVMKKLSVSEASSEDSEMPT